MALHDRRSGEGDVCPPPVYGGLLNYRNVMEAHLLQTLPATSNVRNGDSDSIKAEREMIQKLRSRRYREKASIEI